MLKRQRVLLRLLRQADKAITRLELTKWCFLLRQETPSCGGSAFYDFVPYQYGPFSFSIYQELEKLVAQSYIESAADQTLTLTRIGKAEAIVPTDVSRDVNRIARRFGDYSTNRLLDYVYESYPAFTVNSVRKQLVPRPTADPRVYTAGYEGCSVDRFLSLLIENGIRRLIDVRMNPIARRYGFHKSTLDRLCGKLDIEYVHVPKLGIRSDKRRSLDTQADYDRLFIDYEQTTLEEESSAIGLVAAMVQTKPSVLVCMEADPCSCHRLRLANSIASITGLEIVNLRAE